MYVEPLPRPLKKNRLMKPTRNNGSDRCRDATNTVDALAAIATKVRSVIRAPPKRSASLPPTGRISEPTSGPMNVR